MRFYISTTGIKRLTISSAGAGNGKGSPAPAATRRFSGRTLLPLVLVLALVLPFLFVRIAFIVLESAAACSSSPDCIGWRFFSGSDASVLREELTRALLEAKDDDNNEGGGIESFNQLVQEMTLKQQDVKAFAFRTKAMLLI